MLTAPQTEEQRDRSRSMGAGVLPLVPGRAAGRGCRDLRRPEVPLTAIARVPAAVRDNDETEDEEMDETGRVDPAAVDPAAVTPCVLATPVTA